MEWDCKYLFLMQQKEEEEVVGRFCEGKGAQNSLPEILEYEELISVMLYILADHVVIGQGIILKIKKVELDRI